MVLKPIDDKDINVTRQKIKQASNRKPLLVVISGPSGVGKDATLAFMNEKGLPYHYVLTATTRPMRAGEKNGVDYLFTSRDEFQQMLEKNQLIEWAQVYGNYYGVPKAEIDKAIKRGQDAIVKVDVQGAATIKRIRPDAILIFLMPPSLEELAKRLKQRYGPASSELDIRLNEAKKELERLPIFDYIITNHTDNLNLTVDEINAAIAKCRRPAKTKTVR
jgi:guanylate kinase